jgi:hypothetical protein
MKILAINIGETTSWAFYNSKHAEKINNGRVVYKKAIGEESGPYNRFYNILEDCIYHRGNGHIDHIVYYNEKGFNQDILDCYKGALSDFRAKYQLDSARYIEKNFIEPIELQSHHDKYVLHESDTIALKLLLFVINYDFNKYRIPAIA